MKIMGFVKWNCKKLVAIFYKRWHVMQARRSWIPSWTLETHNSNLSERPKCPISFIKMCLVFFGKVWFSDLPITWLLIKWLACHMASRSQLGVADIMTSFIWHHPHHDVIILPSQRWRIHKSIGKNIHDFSHQITHFLVWFFKSH